MTKLRTGEPWMPAARYAQSLAGLSVNLLVHDIDISIAFQTRVLKASVVYSDADFAVLAFGRGSACVQWMLHAVHTYDSHPLHEQLSNASSMGIGAELRLHGCDPDQAVAAAMAYDYEVVQPALDKAHGLREAFIREPEGYIWVPDVPLVKSRSSNL